MNISWQTIANVATAIALLVAGGAFIWQIISHRQEKTYKRSQFALQSFLESYNQVLVLLNNGNNDRVTWVMAARIVERANSISKNITEQVHIDVLEIQRERYRQEMASIFGYMDENKGAWFFYGSDNPAENIDSAANEALMSVTNIPEGVLATLYTIATYPSNYEDPLTKKTFDDIRGIEMRHSFRGLYDYLESVKSKKTSAVISDTDG